MLLDHLLRFHGNPNEANRAIMSVIEQEALALDPLADSSLARRIAAGSLEETCR